MQADIRAREADSKSREADLKAIELQNKAIEADLKASEVNEEIGNRILNEVNDDDYNDEDCGLPIC